MKTIRILPLLILLAGCKSPEWPKAGPPSAPAPVARAVIVGTTNVLLGWDSPATNFLLYAGTNAGNYQSTSPVATNRALMPLKNGANYFAVAAVYGDYHSLLSNELIVSNGVVPPPPKTNFVFTVQPMTATNLAGPWSNVPGWSAITVTNPPGNRYTS